MGRPNNLIVTGEECATNEFIDGKRVYLRTYICTSIPSNATQEIDLGFIMSDVTVWKISGVISTNTGNTFPLSSGNIGEDTSATVRLSLHGTNNNILLRTINENFVGGEARIIIYYTKNSE